MSDSENTEIRDKIIRRFVRYLDTPILLQTLRQDDSHSQTFWYYPTPIKSKNGYYEYRLTCDADHDHQALSVYIMIDFDHEIHNKDLIWLADNITHHLICFDLLNHYHSGLLNLAIIHQYAIEDEIKGVHSN